nr:ABC transporter [Pseudomonadota bacterium]
MAATRNIGPLRQLLPFIRPYRGRVALALLFLLLAACSTLSFPLALRWLIDGGLTNPAKVASGGGLAIHFAGLFGLALLLGVFSAARYYMVSWLGE